MGNYKPAGLPTNQIADKRRGASLEARRLRQAHSPRRDDPGLFPCEPLELVEAVQGREIILGRLGAADKLDGAVGPQEKLRGSQAAIVVGSDRIEQRGFSTTIIAG